MKKEKLFVCKGSMFIRKLQIFIPELFNIA